MPKTTLSSARLEVIRELALLASNTTLSVKAREIIVGLIIEVTNP
jgi:hypothetical protein